MAKYRINYTTVISQANSVKSLANDLNVEIKKMRSLLERIKTEWKGPASEMYQKKLESLITKMEGTKSRMNSLSSNIKTVANNIQRADNEAAEKVKNNTSLDGVGGSFK